MYFDKYDIKDETDPENARVHMHITHESSPYYYHMEWPSTEGPEQRPKK